MRRLRRGPACGQGAPDAAQSVLQVAVVSGSALSASSRSCVSHVALHAMPWEDPESAPTPLHMTDTATSTYPQTPLPAVPHRLCVDTVKQRAADAHAAAAATEAELVGLRDRFTTSDGEKQRLLDALDKATEQMEALGDAHAALQEATQKVDVLEQRLEAVSGERDGLWGEARALSERLQTADADAEMAKAEAASKAHTLREVQLQLAQQVGVLQLLWTMLEMLGMEVMAGVLYALFLPNFVRLPGQHRQH